MRNSSISQLKMSNSFSSHVFLMGELQTRYPTRALFPQQQGALFTHSRGSHVGVYVTAWLRRTPSCAFRLLRRTVAGQIDQVNQLFILNEEVDGGERYTTLANWSKQLGKIFEKADAKLY